MRVLRVFYELLPNTFDNERHAFIGNPLAACANLTSLVSWEGSCHRKLPSMKLEESCRRPAASTSDNESRAFGSIRGFLHSCALIEMFSTLQFLHPRDFF